MVWVSVQNLAEEIPFPRVLWGRFGLNVGLTEEQAETVLSDNDEDWRKQCSILKGAIENGNAWVEGNSYIPENEITEYNKRFGKEPASIPNLEPNSL